MTTSTATAPATTWTADLAHSSVEFAVKHLVVSTVKGTFGKFAASVTTTDGVLTAIEADIDPASINTGIGQRDDHLRSADFFDVATYPTMKFVSTSVTPKGAGEYQVEGRLTMRGETKPVTFHVEVENGEIKDPWGNRRVGATATGKLSRKEWGLNWNQALEMGGVMVSDEVKFTLNIAATAA
ncbi:MAG TPA: YceI family protein [Gemmatimonadales bacterium]|nr:YceI family protein [Gemmatimonadales bacterium]